MAKIAKRNYKKRNSWGEGSERLLIDIWRSKIDELRGARKNSHIIQTMAVELEKNGVSCTPDEITTKMHNLSSRYRKEKKQIGPSGGAPSDWPLYMEMHQLLASYKCYNTEKLVEDSVNENVEVLYSAMESPNAESHLSPILSSACSSSTPSPTPSTTAAARAPGKNSFQMKLLDKISKVEKEMEKCNKDLKESEIELRETNKAFLESEMKKNKILEEYVNDNKEVNKAIIDFLNRK